MNKMISQLPKEIRYTLFWFRRDLRLTDNAGLYHALKNSNSVLPIFIFDRNILDELDNKKDRRVEFIHQEITRLHQELKEFESSMLVFYGTPNQVYSEIFEGLKVDALYTNHDFEPYARKRDKEISELCKQFGVEFKTFKDHVIFEKDEVVKNDGDPYTVFTPYKKKWLQKLNLEKSDFFVRPYPNEKYASNYAKVDPLPVIALNEMGFEEDGRPFSSKKVADSLLANYDETRDFPAKQGTSQLSIHFRFGTVSIRKKAQRGLKLNDVWLSELIWRDFYQQTLYHFPHEATENFNRNYDNLRWENNEAHFQAWCEGRTGYPMVDAGMRQLNKENWMHNRLRMVTASFLCKHLLIDWKWGERYFADKLLDYDMAANIGGWQWSAGTGNDAMPYFRIFNPESQLKKFDPKGIFIRKWIPEYGTPGYPQPIVEHAKARDRAIARYKEALGRN
jgi:deoxyribodipyrimidine photo-lyase